MLFNSHVFLFAFLPVVFAGFWLLTSMAGGTWARRWILAASIFFFAWWHPPDLLVLGGSLAGNFLIGRLLFARPPRSAGWLLALGVAGNLLLLGYFKYTKLVVATARRSEGAEQGLEFEISLVDDGAGGLVTRHRVPRHLLDAMGMPQTGYTTASVIALNTTGGLHLPKFATSDSSTVGRAA